MAGRNNHFSNASIFFSFLIAAVVLLLSPKEYTSRISLFFCDTFEPILRIGRDSQNNTLYLRPNQDETVSGAEYIRLLKDYKNLQAQLLALHEEYERHAKVRTGLPLFSGGLVMATASVTTSGGNFNHEIIINKGQNASIRPGQYVLSEQSALVGVVSETSETVAKVRLVTDAMQGLEVRIRRDGTNKDISGMMFGNGTNGCKISMIDSRQDVREGDTVFAAAAPNKLNIPVVVGEVTRVKLDDQHQLLWDITVMPVEDMSRLNKVAVIVADESLLKETE